MQQRGYSKQFEELSEEKQYDMIEYFKTEIKDFDSASSTYSAVQELKQLNYNVKGIAVGFLSSEHVDSWRLCDQLRTGLLPEDFNSDIIFALPVVFWSDLQERNIPHAIATVIKKEEKTIYYLDSYNQMSNKQQAQKQLEQCVNTLPELKGYRIITTPRGCLTQQYDNWSCGIHAAQNMVEIITGSINVNNGKGITFRPYSQLKPIVGKFLLAYEAYNINDQKMQTSYRLNKTYKERAKRLLEQGLFLTLKGQMKTDREVFSLALTQELKEERYNRRDYPTFIALFKKQNPQNILLPLFEEATFIKKLLTPASDLISENKASQQAQDYIEELQIASIELPIKAIDEYKINFNSEFGVLPTNILPILRLCCLNPMLSQKALDRREGELMEIWWERMQKEMRRHPEVIDIITEAIQTESRNLNPLPVIKIAGYIEPNNHLEINCNLSFNELKPRIQSLLDKYSTQLTCALKRDRRTESTEEW